MFSKSLITATLLTAVTAHQNFHQFWVNGVSPGYQTSIRMPPSNSPVTDVTSNDITCNVKGNTVPSGVTTTSAKEGDAITVQWDSSTHPGPIQHYLFGPVADASQATGVGSWFKIDEYVQVNGKWANELMAAGNMSYTFKLPTGMASGDYLLRSEMLALHGASTIGGAQWYIGCAQLSITGTGSGSDACGPSIQLPGAYKESDPSIYIPNVYSGFDIKTYTAPGGAVATCGSGSGSGSATAVASSAAKPNATEPNAAVATKSVAAIVSSSTTVNPVPTTFKTAISTTPAAAVATGSAGDTSGNDDECEA